MAGEYVNGVYYKNGYDAFKNWLGSVSDGGISDRERQNLATGLSQGKITQSQYNSLLGIDDLVVGGYAPPKTPATTNTITPVATQTPVVTQTPPVNSSTTPVTATPAVGMLSNNTSVGVRDFSDSTAIDLNNQLHGKMHGSDTVNLNSADDLYQWYTGMDSSKLNDLSYYDQVMYHYLKGRDIGSKDGDAGRKYFNDQQSRLADQFGLPQQLDVGDGRLDNFYGQKNFTTNPYEDAIRDKQLIGGYYDLDGDMGQLGRVSAQVGPLVQAGLMFVPGFQALSPVLQAALQGSLSGAFTAAQGGSTKDVFKSGGTTFATQYLMPKVLGKSGLDVVDYVDPGFVDGVITGTSGNALGQLVMNGDVDLKDAFKAGLMTGGTNTALDYLGDAIQTGKFSNWDPDNPNATGDTSLFQTSDVGKLFGPDGLFKGTDWAGTSGLESVINTIGGGLISGIDSIFGEGSTANVVDKVFGGKDKFAQVSGINQDFRDKDIADYTDADWDNFKQTEAYLKGGGTLDIRPQWLDATENPDLYGYGIIPNNDIKTWGGNYFSGVNPNTGSTSIDITKLSPADASKVTGISEELLSSLDPKYWQYIMQFNDSGEIPTGADNEVNPNTNDYRKPTTQPDRTEVAWDPSIFDDTTDDLVVGGGLTSDTTEDIVVGGYRPPTISVEEDDLIVGGTAPTYTDSGEDIVVGGYQPPGTTYDPEEEETPASTTTSTTTTTTSGGDIGALLKGSGVTPGSDEYKDFMSGISYVMPELINHQIPIKDFVAEYIRIMRA